MGGRGAQFIGLIAGALCLASAAALATGTATPMSANMRDMVSQNGIVLSTPMLSSGHADAQLGMVAFCGRQPDQCGEARGEPTTFTLSDQNWTLMQAVNRAGNAAIAPTGDAIRHGRITRTLAHETYDDSEKTALAKRKALADAGLPRAALRLAMVRLANGAAHAVLTVATDRGDYVLDNRSPAVMPWAQAGFTWIARQAPSEKIWVAIGRS